MSYWYYLITIYLCINSFLFGTYYEDAIDRKGRSINTFNYIMAVIVIVIMLVGFGLLINIAYFIWDDLFGLIQAKLQVRFWWRFYFTSKVRNWSYSSLANYNYRCNRNNSLLDKRTNKKMVKRCIAAVNKRHKFDPIRYRRVNLITKELI